MYTVVSSVATAVNTWYVACSASNMAMVSPGNDSNDGCGKDDTCGQDRLTLISNATELDVDHALATRQRAPDLRWHRHIVGPHRTTTAVLREAHR